MANQTTYRYTQALLHHDSAADKRPMTPTEQLGFFRRRADLRDNAVLECKGTPAEPLLGAYLASYFHCGSQEEYDEYWAARKALDEATK